VLRLHGHSAGAEANPARRPYRVLARGGRDDAGRNHPFTTDAFVVLHDHPHAVWTLPPADCDVSTRWRLIKSRFAGALLKWDLGQPVGRVGGEAVTRHLTKRNGRLRLRLQSALES
jgi:hypothetical protein